MLARTGYMKDAPPFPLCQKLRGKQLGNLRGILTDDVNLYRYQVALTRNQARLVESIARRSPPSRGGKYPTGLAATVIMLHGFVRMGNLYGSKLRIDPEVIGECLDRLDVLFGIPEPEREAYPPGTLGDPFWDDELYEW